MKNNKYFLNTALAVEVGVALAVCVLLRTFIPAIVLPQLSIPNMVLLSLIALLLDHYLAPGAKRCWICIPVIGCLTFGLGLCLAMEVIGRMAWLGVILGLVGAVGMLAAFPVYRRAFHKTKVQYSPRILELTTELSGQV